MLKQAENLSIIEKLSESIIAGVNDLSNESLLTQIDTYRKTIEAEFTLVDPDLLTQQRLQQLTDLMKRHQEMITIVEQRRHELLDQVKQLKRGKRMKKAYPQNHY